MSTTINIKRWGNSNAIRLPQKLLSNLGCNYKSFSAEIKNEKLLLTPIEEDTIKSLDSLFEGFDVDKYFAKNNKNNLEMDWGEPQGLEKI